MVFLGTIGFVNVFSALEPLWETRPEQTDGSLQLIDLRFGEEIRFIQELCIGIILYGIVILYTIMIIMTIILYIYVYIL